MHQTLKGGNLFGDLCIFKHRIIMAHFYSDNLITHTGTMKEGRKEGRKEKLY